MPTVICVKETRVKGYLSIGVKEDSSVRYFTVSKIEYSSLGSPVRGYEVDADMLDTLFVLDEEFRARKKAFSLLSYTDNSERTLRMKLSRAGFSKSAIDKAVGECLSLGYIDEARQLRRLIPHLAEKPFGPRLVKYTLYKKGYSPDKVAEVMRELIEDGEVDFEREAMRLVEKYSPSTDEERRMLLAKYGFH